MRHVMRAVAALTCAAVSLLGPDAGASAPLRDPVGGPLLRGHGIVVSPLPGAPALPKPVSAAGWLVADADTGAVLAAKAPHARYLPASTLKVLTALTLIPRLDPDRLVKVSYDDAIEEGSRVGLVPGRRYTVRELFTCLLVVSANDAADALAEAAGGRRHTVALMNRVARQLQATDTHAGTPSGLDTPGESTSAYDLALLARAAMRLPAFVRYVQTVNATVPAPHHKRFQIYTHNELLTSYHGALGGKNGYTVAAGGTYVGLAHRDGHTLIVSLLHARPDFWDEARALLDWGFAAEGTVTPVGTLVGPRPAMPPAPAPAAPAAPRVALAAHTTPGPASWQVAMLAASAAIAAAATVRRLRRRPRRTLTLPR